MGHSLFIAWALVLQSFVSPDLSDDAYSIQTKQEFAIQINKTFSVTLPSS
jgi:hypothetical protein